MARFTDRKERRRKTASSPTNVPARPPGRYAGASREEMLAGYQKKVEMLQNLSAEFYRALTFAESGSEDWEFWASRLDRLYELVMGGRSLEANARMLLLECTEIAAVLSSANKEELAILLANFRQSDEWVQTQATRQKHGAWLTEFSGNSGAVRAYLRTGEQPWVEPWRYATFDFARREPTFAAALRAPGAQDKLRECIDVWLTRGRPKAGEEAPDKWVKIEELMAAIGLSGPSANTIEAEWRKHKAKRHFAPEKVLFKSPRLPTSVFFGAQDA